MGCGESKAAEPMDMRTRLKSNDPIVRTQAANELGRMGDGAASYVDDLVELLADPERGVRSTASTSLGRLGPLASPAAAEIAKLLDHSDFDVRAQAGEVLGGLGEHAAPTVPQLEELLKKKQADPDIAMSALRVLALIGPKASQAAPLAVQVLMNPPRSDAPKAVERMLQGAGVGEGAPAVASSIGVALSPEAMSEDALNAIDIGLGVLENMGASAGPAAPAVARLLEHPRPEVREQAERLLIKMGTAAGDASRELILLLRAGKEAEPRVSACRVLGALGEYATPCTPRLVRMLLLEDEAGTREAACSSLCKLGEHAEPAVWELMALNIYAQKDDVAIAALLVFGSTPKLAAPAISEIVKTIAHASLDVRNKAIEVLGTLVDEGVTEGVGSDLRKLLSHDSVGVRMSASAALKRISGHATPEEASELARLLGAEKYDTRRQAMDTLETLGDRAAPAAPQIALLLAAPKEDIRATALEALEKLGSRATGAVPDLLELLTHRKEYARHAAKEALKKMGDKAQPEVMKLLKDEDWQVRRRSIEQLGRLGAQAERFVPAIIQLLTDEKLEVSLAAASALTGGLSGIRLPDSARKQAAELLRSSAGKQSLPKYWANQTSDFDEMVYVDPARYEVFDKLLQETYLPRATQDRLCPKGDHKKTPGGCPCVQPGGDPGMPTQYRVRKVIRVENGLMWARYAAKREAIRLRRAGSSDLRRFSPPILSDKVVSKTTDVFAPLDSDLNEVYLFHGTFIRHAISIAKNDFRIDLAGKNIGTMYGRGAYLGESISKADEYTKDEPGGYYNGVLAVLLCRTCMGKLYYTTKRDEEAGSNISSGAFDSTCGDRSKVANTFRELVIYDNDQLYPEYIVLYHRVFAADTPQTIQKALSLPMTMELPLYWNNCFKNITADNFNECLDVSENTLQILQGLVDASLAPAAAKWTVATAKRVENSIVWKKYQSFQLELQKRKSRVAEVVELLTTNHLRRWRTDQSIATSSVQSYLNEHLLWHGTSKSSAESIASESFRAPRNASDAAGLRYGAGVYFSESLDKVLPYASGDQDNKWVLLCRVTCGTLHRVKGDDPDSCQQARKAGRDAVLADPKASGEQREVIVLQASQAYPEFMLELAPRHK